MSQNKTILTIHQNIKKDYAAYKTLIVDKNIILLSFKRLKTIIFGHFIRGIGSPTNDFGVKNARNCKIEVYLDKLDLL